MTRPGLEVGSTRRRAKSACFPGHAWVRGASRIGRPCAARPAPGIVESIVLAPKSTGSSTAKLLAGSSATKNTFLSGHRTRAAYRELFHNRGDRRLLISNL